MEFGEMRREEKKQIIRKSEMERRAGKAWCKAIRTTYSMSSLEADKVNAWCMRLVESLRQDRCR